MRSRAMTSRAEAAARWLPPLAVLVPIVATPIGFVWAWTAAFPLALLVVAGGIAAIAVAGRATYGLRTTALTTVYAWAAAFAGGVGYYIFAINTSLCGKLTAGVWDWLPATAGALAFLAVGSWGLRTQRESWAIALAVGVGYLVLLGLDVVAPGTQGVCWT